MKHTAESARGKWLAMSIGVLAAVSMASVLGFVLACAWGHLNIWIAGFSLFVGYQTFRKQTKLWQADEWVTASPSWNTHSDSGSARRLEQIFTWIVIGFVVWFCARQFLYLFYFSDHSWRILNPNNYGDLAFHIHYIRQMATGAQMPPVNPDFPTEVLRYPLGIDTFNALFEVFGWYTPGHLFVTGMVLTAVTCVVALRGGGWFLLGSLFFSGGLFGLEFLFGAPAFSTVSDRNWQNFLAAMWIPQRCLLLAIPAGLFLILRVRAFIDNNASLDRPQTRMLGCLLGSLAFFHLHSFALLSFWFGIYFCLHIRDRRVRRGLWRIGFWAVLIGGVFLWRSTLGFGTASMMRWSSHAWMNEHSLFSFQFWRIAFLNYGLFLLLPSVLVVIAVVQKNLILRRDTLVFLFSFLLFQFLLLTPWEWDNIKVLFWTYLGLCLIFFDFGLRRLSVLPQILFGCCFFASGFLTILPSMLSVDGSAVLIEQSRLTACDQAVKDLPRDAVFVAGTSHNHCLVFLGRNRVIGYAGLLWAHGIDAGRETRDLISVLKGEEGWSDRLANLNANYIFWGPDERAEFGTEPRPWQTTLALASEYRDVQIYIVPKHEPRRSAKDRNEK